MPPDESLDLFAPAAGGEMDEVDPRASLAERMRPRTLDELLGQEKLLGPGSAMRSLVAAGAPPSMILWGPPGSGKTTLARAVARASGARFEALSAVMAGVKEIREVVEIARREKGRTVLLLDELHRLNRAQQDALLPHVEAGTVTLIGATTENPSFEVNAPLLSRCRVFTLQRLRPETLAEVVRRAAVDEERGLGRLQLVLGDEVVAAIAHAADGDARRALGLRSTTTSYPPSSRACGPATPTPPSTTRCACSKPAKIPCSSRAGS
jgi:putative ATPase